MKGVYRMKKAVALLLVLCISLFAFSGCKKDEKKAKTESDGSKSQKITLVLEEGEREGKYTGDMQNGVPHGHGKFSSQNPAGVKWTYEGEFKNGKFHGKGTTTYEDGSFVKGTYENGIILPITPEEASDAIKNPDEYIGCYAEFVGKVFYTEKANDILGIIIWTDAEKSENPIAVGINNLDMEIEHGDYIKVRGYITQVVENTDYPSMPSKIMAVAANLNNDGLCEIISYKDAVRPALKETEVNQTQTQHGYSVTLQKIEFAEKETRVFVKVTNNGKAEFSLYDYYSKLIQGETQYEDEINYDADYPEIQTSLVSGCTTEGIIVFPATDSEKEMRIMLEGRSDDYSEDFNDFIFTVTP